MPSVSDIILSNLPHVPTEGQRTACDEMVRFLFDADPRSAFILKGYAGTGKTSLVSALIKTAPKLKIRTVLLAPTGRAAKVLSGFSGRTAYTIHKKIYISVTDGSGLVRSVRAQNKYSYTLFIVDEASMISAVPEEGGYVGRHSLLEDLIDFVYDGSHCRLMLIGDGAQLPPVGSSESPALSPEYLRTLADLNVHTAELVEVVRQDTDSGILSNATAIRRKIATFDNIDDNSLPLFHAEPRGDVCRLHGADLEETLNVEYGNYGQEGVALICRSNKRANLYNQAVRNRILFRDDEVGTGDFLMVVKNNYHWLDEGSDMGFIANGDIVEVLSARHYEELYGFHFVDVSLRFVDYPDMPNVDCKLLLETLHSESPSLTRDESQRLFDAVLADYVDLPTRAEQLNAVRNNEYFNALQVKFAYSLTCHKTQGGQWPVVFVEQGYLTDDMIDRDYLRWIYTAVTRATQKVYLLNFEDRFFDTDC
ncbi:MAG: AAA family ATPase [Bacteroidales bacterium]|nr:AAA family ATPase [Bacteroidales bacterium]